MKYPWNRSLWLGLLLICSTLSAWSQEAYIPQYKQSIKQQKPEQQYSKTRQLKTAFSETVELPFIDDFARPETTPFQGLWADNYATINNQYINNFYTIGVATLDAFNQDGYLYKDANKSGFQADYLTSQPINLAYPASDSLYLSFVVQPKGLMDAPETKDSLVLEFRANASTPWQKVWYANYNLSTTDTTLTFHSEISNTQQIRRGAITLNKFHSVLIPIKQSEYLTEAFQFRFRNKASVNYDTDLQSRTGNVDLWHLDMVYLDKNRSFADSVINDVAVSKRLNPLLKNYQSIPWSHFPRANAYEMYDSIFVTYRNTGEQTINFSREFIIEDLYNNNPPYAFTGGTGDDIAPNIEQTYGRKTNYIFPFAEEQDSAAFKVSAWLITDALEATKPFRWNDTITYVHTFKNYYAYDDGTAEGGYGLSGAGSKNGEIAVKFRSYKKDTLQGISLYFNQSINESNRVYFALTIRQVAADGMPGDLIYEEAGLLPEYTDQAGAFTFYALEKPLVLEGEFFIGWRKTSEEMLNVGLDLNSDNHKNRYYMLNGYWHPSSIAGAIQIRPIMGRKNLLTAIDEVMPEPAKHNVLKVYPNPASNRIFIETENNNIQSAQLIDLSGRICKQWQNTQTLSVADIREGIYLLVITHQGQQYTQKLIISRP